jgi:predicted MPP superfamily phosphohydrolase
MKRTLLLAGAGVLLGIYAFFIEPVWLEISIHSNGRNAASPLITVAQLSDLHLHDIGRRERAVMAEISRLQPDLLILSGDVLDRPDTLPLLEIFLAGTTAKHVIATTGNWEYWGDVDIKALRAVYEKHGASLLVNREVIFELKGRKVRVTGLDDFTAGQPRDELLDSPSSADISILVEHSPGFFESPKVTKRAMEAKHFNLCLAGHSSVLLDAEEGALYDDLRDNRLPRNLRLEQERIGFGWIEAALVALA